MNIIQKKKFRKVLFTIMCLALVFTLGVVFCAAEDTGSDPGFGTVLGDFIELLVGGLKSMGEGIGEGVNDYVSNLFFTLDGSGNVTGLSVFGGTVAIFGGIALAIGLGSLIFYWVRSIGN